jgi:hypothetical protein
VHHLTAAAASASLVVIPRTISMLALASSWLFHNLHKKSDKKASATVALARIGILLSQNLMYIL